MTEWNHEINISQSYKMLENLNDEIIKAVENDKSIPDKDGVKKIVRESIVSLSTVLLHLKKAGLNLNVKIPKTDEEVFTKESITAYKDKKPEPKYDKNVVVVKINPLNNDEIIVRTPYNANFVKAIKQVKGRKYDSDQKQWIIPNTTENLEYAKRYIEYYYDKNEKIYAVN